MAAPPTEAELARSATTIDSLPFEILTEVLLCVPTPAALVHAAAASRRWRGAIAEPEFLARYRKRHKSSPFLGLYIPRRFGGPPSFHMPDSIHCAGDDTGSRHLKDAALKAFNIGGVRRYQDHRLRDAVDDAFILGPLGVHPDCRLLDCHNSRLLLTRGDEALEVRSPLARDSILLPFPPDVVHPDSLQACLLQAQDVSFRVVCLQHRREGRRRQVRAVEYDSSRKNWQDHPWETLKGNIEGPLREVMHAGHRIFWKYQGPTTSSLLLDTKNMVFSDHCLPSEGNFAIGEIADNVCGLVETVGCESHRLRVWQLEDKLDWKLKKDTEMNQVLGKHMGYYRPCAIGNGIALVCSITTRHQFLVDLNTCSMKEKLEFHGQSAYLMQMPWPPAFSSSIFNVIGSHHPERRKSDFRLEQGAQCHPKYCVKDPEMHDDVQIATSCCREASAASTAAVSVGECKLLWGGTGSTIKLLDAGKQRIIDASITSAPSLSDHSAGESAEQRGEVARDCSGGKLGLDIEDPTATAPTPATAEQCSGKDKNYVPNDYLYLIPDPCQTRPEHSPSPSPSLGCCFSTGPSQEEKMARLLCSSSIACSLPDTSCSNQDTAPTTASPTDLLTTPSPAEYMEDRQQRMALATAGSLSCPQQGRKWARSRESKGSPEAMSTGRGNWKTKPKYLEAIFALRRHHSFSIASEISDEVQIATSSCRESAASTGVSCQDGYRKTAKQDSNKQTIGKTVAETSQAHSSDDSISGFADACLLSMIDKIPRCSQDHEANDSLRVSPEQVLCRKCGKDGQLVQCSSCLSFAHDSCFGSSVAFEDPGKLYCQICICDKATEECKKAEKTYIEARKSLEAFLGAFLGAEQFFKQHEQQSKLLPRAVYFEGQLIGHNNSSKRKTSVSETTVDDLAHQGEESNRQRKKQKINVRSDACNDVVIEKASSVGNSDVAPMKDSVLQNKSNQLQDAEQDHVENTEAHEGSSSQNRCNPAADKEVESDKEDGSTNSHNHSEVSDGIEFTSPSDSGKPSSPPWRTLKHNRARLQEREATVSSNSRKVFGQKNQHMPSPSTTKRNYAYPPKRYCNPETGRREKLFWTVKEEATLREAMKKFIPRDNGPIPWVQILEYGRNVFHETRLASDLRIKWRNMKNKGDA